jgi:hypothetical protein
MLRRSFTATLARNELWQNEAFTEPYECAWAKEAIFFVRALEARGAAGKARVQISPDGIHWADEGTRMKLPSKQGGLAFARVEHFGGYLRLALQFPRGAQLQAIAALSLKE